MILILCTNAECGAQFRVIGDPREVHPLVGTQSEFYPSKYICPVCHFQATFALESQVDPRSLTKLRDLEAVELYRAQMGLGLPEEQDCNREVVTEMLLSKKVKKVTGHDVLHTNRFCIEWIEFEDGSRMYFGASSHGALVYRITKSISHVEEVLKELE